MALHLYIPPSSCHAPGIATGLIFGHFLRVYQLCSHQHDIDRELQLFYQRLLDRGYTPSVILPLFAKAEANARKRIAHDIAILHAPHNTNTNEKPTHRSQLFLHLPFHPANPPSTTIQHLWNTTIALPPNDTPLTQLHNKSGYKIEIEKLTIAYSRAPNLGNLLSCRKLKGPHSRLRPIQN